MREGGTRGAPARTHRACLALASGRASGAGLLGRWDLLAGLARFRQANRDGLFRIGDRLAAAGLYFRVLDFSLTAFLGAAFFVVAFLAVGILLSLTIVGSCAATGGCSRCGGVHLPLAEN